MSATTQNNKKSNRRVAFRIYEQANLFYQPIAPNQSSNSENNFDTILHNGALHRTAGDSATAPSLPFSQSQENDTLNVNISATGIAFTCQEKLQPGDYLLLRILLLSSMTVIMASCQVAYCTPSNPYENNRYPYSIGARFVNLTPEDSALLTRHVNRRKKQQWLINGSLATLVLAILAAPDYAFGLLASLAHHLFGMLLHGMHLAFESLEMALDHAVEHLFHTDRHVTQIIVFYILVLMGLLALYFLSRTLPALFLRSRNSLLRYWSRKKSSCMYYWNEQTLSNRVKIIGISITAVAGYIYFNS